MNVNPKTLPAATTVAVIALSALLATAAPAQTGNPPQEANRPASGAGGPPGGPGGHGPQKLSPEQETQVKAIVAKYKPASLTVDDAKALKRALRDAGIRPGPGLAEALKANGISVERLEQLDPRPNGGSPPGDGGPRGGRPDGPPPAPK